MEPLKPNPNTISSAEQQANPNVVPRPEALPVHQPEQPTHGPEQGELPQSSPAAPDPQAVTQAAQDAQAVAQPIAQPQAPAAPVDDQVLIAADQDVIEKEWVAKAKQIVIQTRDDPHAQEHEVSKLQADYLQKRFGKEIKLVDI